MENKTEEKQSQWNLESNKISNIIAVISCLVSIVGVVVSVYSLRTAQNAINVVNNIDANDVGSMQNANIINNNGTNVKDVDFISKENDKEMMDKAYKVEDILKLVEEDPNLNFSLVWSGSREEYNNINYDEKLQNASITYYIHE